MELHRRFEGIAPAVVRGIMTVKGSEAPMRQVKEDAESEILSFAVGRRERALQHGARGREVGRQMGVQHAREVLTALHESKGRQAGGGGATKRRGVKFRPGECEIVREAVDRVAIEERGERAAFLNRARCHRQAERAGQGALGSEAKKARRADSFMGGEAAKWSDRPMSVACQLARGLTLRAAGV